MNHGAAKDDTVTVRFQAAGGTLKVQAKDQPAGRDRPDGTRVRTGSGDRAHPGPGLFSVVNEFTEKIDFGDGIDAVTPAQSATGQPPDPTNPTPIGG